MKMFKLFVVVAMVCLATPAVAVETVMDQVVVTATRVEEELKTVPANVTIITQEEIEQSAAETVPEVLRYVPGVLVSDVTGNGRRYNIDLRGFGETGLLNTLVLVDGRRVNLADLSGVDWTLIPKDRVARIEIVRGGRGSVLYGDNAAGGVINIITKQGTKDMKLSVNGAMGSYGTTKGDFAVSKVIDDFSIALNANYRISDGYRDNSDTLSKDVGIDLRYDATERLSFRLSGGYHEDETGMPGRLTDGDLAGGLKRTDTIFPEDFADTDDWYVQLGSQYYLTDSSYLDLSVSKRERDVDSLSVFWGWDFVDQFKLDVTSISPKLVLNESLLGRPVTFLVGFDYEESEMDVFSDSIFSTSNHDLTKENYGYYAHGEVTITDPLSISAGFRKDRVEYDFKSIEANLSGSNEIDEELVTVGLNYLISEHASVYSSYSKSFRHPNLDEMYDRPSDTVKIGLNSQKSDDYELGMRYSTDSGLNLGVNLFYMETEDEILLDPMPYTNVNLDGESVRKGIELSTSYKIYDVLLSGSYKYTNAEIEGGPYDGKEIPFVPEHQATVGVQTGFGEHVLLGLNGVYVGERRFISDFDNVDGYLDDYFNLAGKLTYLLKAGSVYLAVNNILNEEYSEYGTSPTAPKAYYPSPKINFMVGVNFTF